MLCDVVRRRRRRRRWAHAPVIHPFSIIMGLRLAALRAAGAPLKITFSSLVIGFKRSYFPLIHLQVVIGQFVIGYFVIGQFVIGQFVIGQFVIGQFNKPITFKEVV